MARKGRTRRGRTWPWVLLFGSISLVALFYGGGGWFFSSKIYDRALRAESYEPSTLQTGQIVAISGRGNGGSITTLASEAERSDTSWDDGTVGLKVGDSLVVAGPATLDGDNRVREILDVQGRRPQVGDTFGLARDVWLTPAQAGMTSTDVDIETLDGRTFPAWSIKAKEESRDWAVLIHGRGATRSEMLRMGRSLHVSGWNLLIVTYTGDKGVPAYPDGMSQFGRTEWKEIDAAVTWVREQGSRRIILGGASHGGAVALGFMARSTQASRIDALMLDAPASSLRDVIDYAADYEVLPVIGKPIPESLENVAMLFVAWRFGVNFATVDYSGMPNLLHVPVLTIQGGQDRTVPQPVNDRFMAGPGDQPGSVYWVVPSAGHVMAWNIDPQGYAELVAKFLAALPTPES